MSHELYVRMLGPLEVLVGGTEIAIGGPKPRALLAALLVRRGAAVPVDTLAAALWGDEPPPGAVSTVRAYVSRLRAALEVGGADRRLHFRSGGYAVDVTDDELDAATVERLLAEARGADRERAVELLDDALGRWRGDALAEFADLDFARAEAARLAELRLAATEERIDALLHLGRGAEVVAALDSLVRRFPDRERPAVQLMQALYGSGRQADAMAVYHALRHRLDVELGVEPSALTRSLYQRILDHDPALAPAPVPARGNLPRRVTSFVGRDDELTGVSAAVRAVPLVTLTGVGGVGKSRLALEVAGRDRARYPDGVWLCELAPLSHGGPVGHAVAASLRVQQRHGLSIDETVIEYLRSRRLLLVLDNCEHVLDAAARLADQVVAQCAGVVVLATSRTPLGVDGEQTWPVPPLSIVDATALFVHRARAHRPDFDADQEARDPVTDICRRLDGLPLAIELAAARTRAMSAAEVADRLDGGALLTRGRPVAAPRHQSLAAAIGWSYELLSPPERVLFARLSVFAGGFDLHGVHGVCADADTTEAGTLDLLTGLVDRSMVVAAAGPAGSRYRVLETLRAYGRERLRDAAEEQSLARRHAGYFTELAERAAAGMRGRDEPVWVARTLAEGDNLRAAFERAHVDEDADLVMRLAAALPEVTHIRVGYEAAGWAERALDLVTGDHPQYVAAVGAAARGAWNRGDFERARRLAAMAGSRAPAAGTGRVAYPGDVLADVALYEGDVEAAKRHYEAEVTVARGTDDPIRLGWALYYVAICHAVQRAPALGLAAASECLQVAGACENPTAMSMARYALGLVRKKSDPDGALALFDEAAELAAAVHNFWWQGIALMEAAATRAVHGDPAVAARGFVDVLDHWERVGDWTQQWLNLRYVVRLLVRLAPRTTRSRCTTASSRRPSRRRWTAGASLGCSTARTVGGSPPRRLAAAGCPAPVPSRSPVRGWAAGADQHSAHAHLGALPHMSKRVRRNATVCASRAARSRRLS